MRFLHNLGLENSAVIDWRIDPLDTYGMFECRGDMTQVRSKEDRFYYFFIDNWERQPRLCFMERGIRYARIVARVAAPDGLIRGCVAEQGHAAKYQSLRINEAIRKWLEEKVIEPADMSLVEMVAQPACGLPPCDLPSLLDDSGGPRVSLRREARYLAPDDIAPIVRGHDFFESVHNSAGAFCGRLFDGGDGLTVVDAATGLRWQRGGSGIGFFRRMGKWAGQMDAERFAGHGGWRLPTLEEALSLLRPQANACGQHLHPCFSPEQGYIYTADRRKPGGYWFVDFGTARVFWAGGTMNGGFARLVCECVEQTAAG